MTSSVFGLWCDSVGSRSNCLCFGKCLVHKVWSFSSLLLSPVPSQTINNSMQQTPCLRLLPLKLQLWSTKYKIHLRKRPCFSFIRTWALLLTRLTYWPNPRLKIVPKRRLGLLLFDERLKINTAPAVFGASFSFLLICELFLKSFVRLKLQFATFSTFQHF